MGSPCVSITIGCISIIWDFTTSPNNFSDINWNIRKFIRSSGLRDDLGTPIIYFFKNIFDPGKKCGFFHNNIIDIQLSSIQKIYEKFIFLDRHNIVMKKSAFFFRIENIFEKIYNGGGQF